MRKADNLPPSCAVVTKSGNLNFVEPSGPLRACNGTALPLLCYFQNIPLDDLKYRRGYCQLKEEALDRTMWRNRFGRGFGPVF